MTDQQILEQSKAAYGQWCVQWREQALEHSKFKQHSLSDLALTGIGKVIVAVANGYSFEENIQTLIDYKDQTDIICCDKTLGHLLDHGIKPKYCLICDANVNYELYMEKYKDQLKDTIALINVCANPKWAKNGNWKKIYFFINKDILNSELEFQKISGCNNIIPAGTNVSNAMVIMLTQCDNQGKQNFFGYDKIALIGYDYSWCADGKYYAFNKDGDLKADYMKHQYCMTTGHHFAYTSGNLYMSSSWLETYVKSFKLNIVNCTDRSILTRIKTGKLKDQITYKYKTEDSSIVISQVARLQKVIEEKLKIEKALLEIEKDHQRTVYQTV